MIRTVKTEEIARNIKEMCIEANHYLSKDMDNEEGSADRRIRAW